MRLFYAVEIPALPPWGPTAGPPEPNAGVPAAPPHLTLRFLGERPASTLAVLEQAGARAVAGLEAFAVELRTIGAFPSKENPRIVWLGVDVGSEELTTLAGRLASALADRGIPPDRRAFVPHVTWKRVHSRHDRIRARTRLEEGALPAPIVGRVRELLLKESELSPSGARHRTVATFPLGEGGPTAQLGSRPTSS